MYPGQVMTDSRNSSVERQVVNSISCYCQCSTNVITHTHTCAHTHTHTSHCGNDINERSNCAGKLIECGCCDLSTALLVQLVSFVAFNWASLCFVLKLPELSQRRSKVTVDARWECANFAMRVENFANALQTALNYFNDEFVTKFWIFWCEFAIYSVNGIRDAEAVTICMSVSVKFVDFVSISTLFNTIDERLEQKYYRNTYWRVRLSITYSKTKDMHAMHKITKSEVYR